MGRLVHQVYVRAKMIIFYIGNPKSTMEVSILLNSRVGNQASNLDSLAGGLLVWLIGRKSKLEDFEKG